MIARMFILSDLGSNELAFLSKALLGIGGRDRRSGSAEKGGSWGREGRAFIEIRLRPNSSPLFSTDPAKDFILHRSVLRRLESVFPT